jgi:hypothetical protein
MTLDSANVTCFNPGRTIKDRKGKDKRLLANHQVVILEFTKRESG